MREVQLAPDLVVGEIGLGCSTMSHGYGSAERDDEESIRVIRLAVDMGVTIFDTADVYGPYSNERLLGRALGGRAGVQVATKCGLVPGPNGKFSRNARPEHIRAACEASLRRLRVEAIDLYQLHRVDPDVPVEETWGALRDLVAEGKVRGLGISHATCDELDLLHKIWPITAVQYELSILARQSLDDVLPWCVRNGVGFLAFAPVGRGFLSGRLGQDHIGSTDSRIRDPRFNHEAMRANWLIVEGIRRIAARHNATPAQIAIAWTLLQGDKVIPIPGTRHRHWLRENVAAAEIRLTEQDRHEIDNLPAATGTMRWDHDRFPDIPGTAAAAVPVSAD